ncbi:MAG TPA: hypothetical protein VJR06_03365 [Nitrososphaerales archaeon]|nr:hypothetical protein [Nitrososphaerales archaeon]
MTGTISVEGANLVFEMHGVDEILAIKRTLQVPLEHVLSASADDTGWQFPQMKVAGTDLPGIVKDGRFVTSEGLVFFEMHHPEKCVTVALDHDTYKKIIFEVEDKEQAAKMINDAVAQRAKLDAQH